jgi:hypothetical protein
VVPFARAARGSESNSACQSIGFAFATAASIGSIIAIAEKRLEPLLMWINVGTLVLGALVDGSSSQGGLT